MAARNAIPKNPPFWNTQVNDTIDKAITAGKERSISPVMITKVKARAMIRNNGVVDANAR